MEGWSYEAGATTRVREILGVELRTSRTGVHYLDDAGLKALEGVASRGDLRELVANLMVHHSGWRGSWTPFPRERTVRGGKGSE